MSLRRAVVRVAAVLTLSTAVASSAADKKAATPQKPSDEPKEKAFAEVVKGAQEIKGLFTIHRTEETAYLEILPEQLDRTYYVALTLESGIGEGGFYAAQMGGVAPLAFHKQGKSVQLVRKNVRFTARPGTPIERAVALLAHSRVASE